MESTRYMANVVTAANLLFGAMSILLSVMGKYVQAAWIIFFSIIFDIADGKIARMDDEPSEFGKQFDSLADLVSFVVAPSILIFTLSQPEFLLWRLLVCLVVVFCGAFRLARFNTETGEKENTFFKGLPSPAFAASAASFVLVYHHYNLQIDSQAISLVVGILAMMMVSGIEYPTFKDIPLFQRKYLVGFALILPLIFVIPELTTFILSLIYVIFMPFVRNKVESSKEVVGE